MSPSESDLRAALQDGDDAGLSVNADAIIAEGQAIRGRRVRIMSGAAAAVLVAAGAVGLAVARGNDGHSSLAGGGAKAAAPNVTRQADGGRSADRGQGGAPVAPAATPAATTSAPVAPVPVGGNLAAVACPTSAPHLLVPGGGSSGQFGSDAPLFSKSVDTLIVCVYGATPESSSNVPARLTFTGRKSAQIVASMEHAGRTPNATPCDPGLSTKLVAFIGVTSDGTTLPPVTAMISNPACNLQLTNGTAVRYGWTPPAVLTGELNGLTPPRTVITVPNEPTEQGSPPHS